MSELGQATAPFAIGNQISHYRLLEEIGRGGMGVVFRALDLNLDRQVALKCVRPDLTSIPEHRRRLLREARAAARISHPNVVPVFEVLEDSGLWWLAMELVDGSNLRVLLRERGHLELRDVLRHAEELAGALAAAHDRRVLHRDISPNNVLVASDGRCRLMDFGLARVHHREGDQTGTGSSEQPLTQEWLVFGTPGYMSPEQVLGRRLDQRSDIFSLGAVLYEMCAGRPAFPHTSPGNLVDATLNREPPSFSHLGIAIPEELERIIRKALAKLPEERYQSARELAADAHALRLEVESGGQVTRQTPRLAPPGRRRRRRLWLPAAVVASACAIAVAVWLPRRHDQRVDWLVGTPRQLTSAPGWEADPAISPDGSLIAYSSNEPGNPDIYLMDARGGEALRLTNDPASDRSPAWFPDSSALAFVSDRGGYDAIWKVPRLGGGATLLVPDATDPAVSPDGSRVAYARAAPSGYLRIEVAPLSSPLQATRLTGDGDGVWDHSHPAWSPDGRQLCYCDQNDLWVVPAAGGRPARLTVDHLGDIDPVWSADGRVVLFASYRGGTLALWQVPAGGGAPTRLTLGTGPECEPSVSLAGSRLAYSTYHQGAEIVLDDRQGRTQARVPSARRQYDPILAPDLNRLWFTSERAGAWDLWVQQLSHLRPAGAPLRLTELPGSISHPMLSPDGRWIVCHRVVEGQRDIWVIPSAGGLPTQITTEPSVDINPAWSPDGNSIVFTSDRDGHEWLWALPVAQGRAVGPARRITGGETSDHFPVWSPDGSVIAFAGDTGGIIDLWVVDARGARPARRLTSGAAVRRIEWDRSGETMLVSATWGNGHVEIRRLSLTTGRTFPLDPPLVMGPEPATGQFSASLDGQQIAYCLEALSGDVWVVDRGPQRH